MLGSCGEVASGALGTRVFSVGASREFREMKFLVGLVGLVVCDPSSLWPRPKTYTMGNSSVVIDPKFEFTSSVTTPILSRAMKRYQEYVQRTMWSSIVPTFAGVLDGKTNAHVGTLDIVVKSTDESLGDGTDESYTLEVAMDSQGKASACIQANTVFGALHGMESFTQMVQYDEYNNARFVAKAPFKVQDAPAFTHRGLLLDTSRNFYPVEDILRTIRALSMNKMNVFHWHMIDSHSWPFQSKHHPLLSVKGAILPDQVYSYKDIRQVVQFGLDHGVRVIPELEAPAHSYALGLAYPDLVVCKDDDEWDLTAAEPPSGQIDPTNPKSIQVVGDIIDEFAALFPEKYIHLSGDEVNTKCWNNSGTIRNYLKSNNIPLDDLLPEFAKKMQQRAVKNEKSVMVWQEIVLNHNVTLPPNSLVQVWLGAEDTKKVVERGYRVVASSYQYWYLDCGHGAWIGDSPSGSSWCDPFKHWQIIYTYDLLKNLTSAQQSMVAGGEVAVWSEQVDEVNLDRTAWPRTSAAAEVLWSGNRDADGNVMRTKSVLPRLNNFRFYMVQHGIQAEPLQPLWCVVNPGRCDSTSGLKNLQAPYVPPTKS